MPAPPRFARFVAIDWSGARLPSAQRRAIVRCVVERRAGDRQVIVLEGGRDRQEIVAWLADVAKDGVPTLVGLDFPFAYAAPFLDHLGAADFVALLACMASLGGSRSSRPAPPSSRGAPASASDDQLHAFVATCGEWWGRWGRRDDLTRRQVERVPATRGAESPLRALKHGRGYRFVGPRQVGKAAITGLAALAALKARVPDARMWPFEDPGGASLVLAEIWPRLALRGIVKRDPAARRRCARELGRQGIGLPVEHERAAGGSDHALDALAAAVAMASGRWPVLDLSALPPRAAREGWISEWRRDAAPDARSAGDQPEGAPVGEAQQDPARTAPA